MRNVYFYLIIIFYIYDFVFNQFLAYLNRTRMNPVMPKELEGIYDPEEYARQQRYQKENSRFDLISGGVRSVITLTILLFGLAGRLDTFLRSYTEHWLRLPLSFVFVLIALSLVMHTSFDAFETFVIEKKFGFNRTTPRTFITDMLKSLALTLVLTTALLAGILAAYEFAREWFWMLAWFFTTLLTLVISFFYSEWIVPIFNRQTPLEEGELRSAIEAFAQKASFPVENIYVMDGSKRSTKSNAYFTGFGKKKRIVLYDTLIDDLTTEEITAVLAHEIGHCKMKHVLIGVVCSLARTGFTLWILSLFMENFFLAQALGGTTPSFHLNMVAFSFLTIPLYDILDFLSGVLSRKHEYGADNFTVKYGMGASLISALKKISAKSLSNMTPHPLVVALTYSHPTLLQRIRNIQHQQSAQEIS